MAISSILVKPWRRIIGLAILGASLTLMLLFSGFLAAVLPSLVVRILPFGLLVLVVLLACFNQKNTGISEQMSERWLNLLILTFVLWPSYMIFKFGSLPSIDGRKVVVAFSLLTLIYLVINRKVVWASMASCGDRVTSLMSKIVLSYVVLRGFSCLFSSSPIESTLIVFWDVFYYYGIFFLAVSIFGTRGAVRSYVRILLVLTVTLALLAIIERLIGRNPILEWAPRSASFEDFNAALQITRFRDGVFRSQATFEHPLLLAEFASIGTCFGLAYGLWGGVSRRYLGWLSFFAGIVALILSGSRSGYLACGGAVMIISLLWFLRARKSLTIAKSGLRVTVFFLGLILTLGLSVPILTTMAQGKTVSESTSSDARLAMLERGLPSVKANPLFGTGPGSASTIAGIVTGSKILTLDNYLLALAIESGLPALLFFLASLLYPAWRATYFVLSHPSDYSPFAAAVVGSVFAVIVMRSFLWMPYNLSLVYIMIGLLFFAMRDNGIGKFKVGEE